MPAWQALRKPSAVAAAAREPEFGSRSDEGEIWSFFTIAVSHHAAGQEVGESACLACHGCSGAKYCVGWAKVRSSFIKCWGCSDRPSDDELPLCPLLLQKRSQEGINTRLQLVMKSGKYTLGTKTCLKCLRSGKGV